MSSDGILLSTEDFLAKSNPEVKLNFFTFKWGTLYGPEYVNRLYGSIKRFCDLDFNFTCITDNPSGINPDVGLIDYNTFGPDHWRSYGQDKIFTREKLCLFDLDLPGTKLWVDLDNLIHGDITELVSRDFDKPTFILNHWNIKKEGAHKWFGKGSDCHVNSSFVAWQDAQWLFDYTNENLEKLMFTYKSLDKYLYYQHYRNDRLAYWEEGIVDNYNFSEPPHTEREEARMTLFNTSHIRIQRMGIEAFELHETEGQWPWEYWTSYDAS
jgi:hypothetical protein